MATAASAVADPSTNGRFSTDPELHLRPIEPADAAALQDAFEHLSPLSRYYRFHAGMRRLPDELLERLTHIDGVNHVALVAFEQHDGHDEGVAVARFVRLVDAPNNAEVAVTVIDRAQGHGIGRRMLAALAKLARARGITTFTLHVLSANGRARRMALQLGAVAKRGEQGVIDFELPVSALAENDRPSQAA